MVRAGSSLLLALLPWCGVALAAPQLATVLSVGDGDTLRLRQGASTLTVRLACIDAPERAQAPWGQQARRQLQTLAPIGSAVTLRSKATDRYGRQVAELSRKGRNINQALVASGAAMAWNQSSEFRQASDGLCSNCINLAGSGRPAPAGGWKLRMADGARDQPPSH